MQIKRIYIYIYISSSAKRDRSTRKSKGPLLCHIAADIAQKARKRLERPIQQSPLMSQTGLSSKKVRELKEVDCELS